MAESQKPPAASLTDPLIRGNRLGGGGMFMGGGPSMLLPLSVTDISQNNFQTKIGNPMFASTNINAPESLAKLGRAMLSAEEFLGAKARVVGNYVGGNMLDTVAGAPERMARNAMYGKFPDPRPSTTPLSLYQDYRSIRSPVSNARLGGVAGGIGQTTVSGVAGGLLKSAARGGVFSAVMPFLPLGEGSEITPQMHFEIEAKARDKDAEKKMLDADAQAMFRAGLDPRMHFLRDELPQKPMWKDGEMDGTQNFTPEEMALGDYEAILERRLKAFKETERLSKLPTFNAVQDKGSFMSAHFMRPNPNANSDRTSQFLRQ